MRKIILLLTLASSLCSLAGCENSDDDPVIDPESETYSEYKDSDFDGLYDSIDPLPNDNEFIYYYQSNGDPDSEKSNPISANVDFRYFLDDKFNLGLSQMSGLLAYFGYPERGIDWYFSKNNYKNEESELNPCLVNFGFKDIVKVDNFGKFENDEADICGAFFGNHIFENEDGNKYQIVACNLIGYPDNIVWNSNFDIGCDSDGYDEIFDYDHEYWTNKKHHKGFDVSANRFYPELLKYLETVEEDEITQIVWVTGHSRSGAIANLIGKRLFDDEISSTVYAFNNPNTTTESDEEILKKYKNIYNVRPENDLLAQFPFAYQGFTSYGNQLRVNLTLPGYSDEYERVFKTEFEGNTKEIVDTVTKVSKEYFGFRESIYEYDEKFSSVKEILSDTYEEALAEAREYQDSIYEANLKNITKLDLFENPDYVEGLNARYLLKYTSKPIIAFKVLGEIMSRILSSSSSLISIVNYVLSSFPFVKDILVQFGLELIGEGVSLNFAKFGDPHDQKTTVVGSYCVLDENL